MMALLQRVSPTIVSAADIGFSGSGAARLPSAEAAGGVNFELSEVSTVRGLIPAGWLLLGPSPTLAYPIEARGVGWFGESSGVEARRARVTRSGRRPAANQHQRRRSRTGGVTPKVAEE